MKKDNSLPKILYIMGTGRSGTTILEIVLKANANIDGLGEMTHFLRDGLINNYNCSCGKASHSCPVWAPAVKYLKHFPNNPGLKSVNKNFEGHLFFPIRALGFYGDIELHKQVNLPLFSRTDLKANCEWVIDSSKYAARPLLLKQWYNSDIRVIAITRSPIEIFAAFQTQNEDEQKPKSYLGATLYYLFVVTCMKISKMRLGKRCVAIRYEDFVSNPNETLQRVESSLGIDLSESRRRLKSNTPFEAGHIVTGNRLRKQQKIIFKVRKTPPEIKVPSYARLLASFLSVYRRLLRF